MKIEKITSDKKRFLELLLLADEQESMIDRYLERRQGGMRRGRHQRGERCLRIKKHRRRSKPPKERLGP